MTDDRELLASAYLDGDVTAEERARVEGDPELLAEVQRLGEIRAMVADVEPPLSERRESHLAAAMAARDQLPGSPHPVPTPDAPADRDRRRFAARWAVAAAAAVALAVGAGIVISTTDGADDQDIAGDVPAATDRAAENSADTEATDDVADALTAVTEAPADTEAGTAGEAARDEAMDDSEDVPADTEAMEESAELTEDTEAPADAEAPADTEATDRLQGGEESADDVAAETGPADGAAVIVEVAAFDPDGDGTENDAAAAALAGPEPDLAASWSTECYADQFMGDKRGVGLVLSFDRPSDRSVVVDVRSAPYQVRFYAATSQRAPSTFEAWGEPLGQVAAGAVPAEVRSPALDEPVRHVLVVFDQLGADPGCSQANPYRGTIGAIRSAP